MWLLAKLRAVRRKLASDGLSRTIRLTLRHALRPILHREVRLYYVDLPHYHPPAFGDHLTLRPVESFDSLTPDDLKALLDYAGEHFRSELRTRLAHRWVLFLCYLDGEVAGGGWALTSATEFRSKVVPLLDADVALIDAFTFHDFRGRNVYPALLSTMACHYKEKGLLRAFGYVNEQNVASVKGLEKAGFRSSLAYESYRIGSSEIVVWKRFLKRHSDPGQGG